MLPDLNCLCLRAERRFCQIQTNKRPTAACTCVYMHTHTHMDTQLTVLTGLHRSQQNWTQDLNTASVGSDSYLHSVLGNQEAKSKDTCCSHFIALDLILTDTVCVSVLELQ